ncbi:MAG: hypothetical protein J6I80_03955, partial [Clostridia bacterium]|nr:hypothetical protein [Clostridia bacterium]
MKALKRILSVLMIFALLITLGITAAVPASAADNEIAATDSRIRYTGHWVKDGSNMKGYFQSTIEVRFTGTSLKVKCNRALAVKIDNGDYEIKEPVSGTTIAASGLSSGNHKAILIISVPIAASNGPVNTLIAGFTIDSGATLLEPDDAKHIAFIGDSITMGHYGQSSYWPSGAGYKDSIAKNYVTKLATKLGMVPNATAIGGHGIDKANSTDIDTIGMTERCFRLGGMHTDGATKTLDTSLYAPDYIVVALGTNGSYSAGTAATAQNAYENMLKKLRTAYPSAKIFCVTPFQSTGLSSLNIKKEDIIKASVDNRKDDGDKNIYYIDATYAITNTAQIKKDPAGQTTDGVHPTYEGHTKIAEFLETEIKFQLLKESSASNSSKKTYSKYSRVQRTSSEQATDKTESVVEDTTSKKGNTSKKNNTNSKVTSADKDATVNENITEDTEIIETIGED